MCGYSCKHCNEVYEYGGEDVLHCEIYGWGYVMDECEDFEQI